MMSGQTAKLLLQLPNRTLYFAQLTGNRFDIRRAGISGVASPEISADVVRNIRRDFFDQIFRYHSIKLLRN